MGCLTVIKWYSRKVLSWRLSNTLDPRFCVEALEEALEKYDCPQIFKTDQCNQYTGSELTGLLKASGIRISTFPPVGMEKCSRFLNCTLMYLGFMDLHSCSAKYCQQSPIFQFSHLGPDRSTAPCSHRS
ncbi:MAG: DDE-type integrase/transposase/recombinase [Candidatus Fermentibacter daniensis]|nr:DDE-type integrase/transposase/recombinase [Candidatus Fermentibacter sp.]NLI02014.1 DDE-type integrase/transposase/recombinase [Candidatus Fermentibacter daniensis]